MAQLSPESRLDRPHARRRARSRARDDDKRLRGPPVPRAGRRPQAPDARPPEYNTAKPGQVKHLVDWASRPHGPDSALWGKPAAAIGASVTEYGAMWAQDHLRRALGIAGARVLDSELALGNADELFDGDAKLTDGETRKRVADLVDALVEHHHTHSVAA